jgi:cardiolipin synthase
MHLSGIRPWKSLNWPNRISLLRLLFVAPYVILLMNQNDPGWGWARYAALGIFAAMAVSDALDGYLARKYNARTRLGAILDPMADKAMVIASVVLLSLPMAWVTAAPLAGWVVVIVVAKDLWLILGFLVVYLVTDRFRVRPSVAGKVCTIVQCLMIGLTLLAPDLNAASAGLGTWTARAASWAAAAACAVAAVSYTLLGLAFIAHVGEKPLEGQAANRNHGQH